jgi:hypothetical protein
MFSPSAGQEEITYLDLGETMKVLHLSDFDMTLAARQIARNTSAVDFTRLTLRLDTTATNASVPASKFGYLYCDSPPDLALSAFSHMDQFVNCSSISFNNFTGDRVVMIMVTNFPEPTSNTRKWWHNRPLRLKLAIIPYMRRSEIMIVFQKQITPMASTTAQGPPMPSAGTNNCSLVCERTMAG